MCGKSMLLFSMLCITWSATKGVSIREALRTKLTKCDLFCPLVYDPICGSDGVTYSNGCFLFISQRCYGSSARIAYKGACGSSRNIRSIGRQTIQSNANRSKCFTLCTQHYAPVCSTSGITYPNSCQVMISRCLGKDVRINYNGACRGTQ